MAVIVAKCTCQHEFQDKTYGKGMRVWNSCGKDSSSFRCTVCSSKTGGSGTTKRK